MKLSNEELIKSATAVFWKKGYSAVGMRELQTAKKFFIQPGFLTTGAQGRQELC